jgi:hypothetical protein
LKVQKWLNYNIIFNANLLFPWQCQIYSMYDAGPLILLGFTHFFLLSTLRPIKNNKIHKWPSPKIAKYHFSLTNHRKSQNFYLNNIRLRLVAVRLFSLPFQFGADTVDRKYNQKLNLIFSPKIRRQLRKLQAAAIDAALFSWCRSKFKQLFKNISPFHLHIQLTKTKISKVSRFLLFS